MFPSMPNVYDSWGRATWSGPIFKVKDGSVARIHVSPGKSTVNSTTRSTAIHNGTSHQRERRNVTAAHADNAVIGRSATDLSKKTRSHDSLSMNLALCWAAWAAPGLSGGCSHTYHTARVNSGKKTTASIRRQCHSCLSTTS